MIYIGQYCTLLKDIACYEKSEECFKQDFPEICQNIWDMAIRRTNNKPDTLDNYNSLCTFITRESSYLCKTTFGKIAMSFRDFKEPLEWINPHFKQEWAVEIKPLDAAMDEANKLPIKVECSTCKHSYRNNGTSITCSLECRNENLWESAT
jgi:hypothetical protein